MAPIRRFSAAEKGKAPREGPDPLPPKKRLALRGRVERAHQVVSRPWCERPPPGFPLPLYAHIEGSEGVNADRHGRRLRLRRRVTKVWVVLPGVHTEGSSREFVLHVVVPLQSWIRLPPFFASIIPLGEPLELWLQHAGYSTLVTEAEIAVVALGEVYMTRGWREIARVCRTRGVFAIHLDYDGASVMLFKVFDASGRRLKYCPGEGGQGPAVMRTGLATRSLGGSSGDGGVGGSSDSGEPFATPETSDDSYEPPSQRRSWGRAGSSGRRRL